MLQFAGGCHGRDRNRVVQVSGIRFQYIILCEYEDQGRTECVVESKSYPSNPF